MTSAPSTLSWIDYVILAAFLGVSLAIGVYHALTGGRQRTTAEFILADRQLKVIPTALSLFVSFQSAIAILGTTAEMYAYGVQLMIMGPVAVVIGIVIAERLFVPWMFRLRLVSVNEVCDCCIARYSRPYRATGKCTIRSAAVGCCCCCLPKKTMTCSS
jgi:Na+/proline symporter